MRIEKTCFAENAWDRDLFEYYFNHPASISLIAAINKRVVGYTIAVQTRAGWALDSIAVLPSAQGHGVATRLIQRLRRDLIQRNATRLTLMVRCDNDAAIHLYKKMGFKRTGSVDRYYEDGSPARRMRLDLTP